MPEYKINVVVDGTASGSDKFAGQEEQVSPNQTNAKKKQIEKQTKTQQLIDAERLQRIKAMSSGGLAVGALVLDQYEQNANLKGDSNTTAQIGEAKKWGGRLLVAGGLLATGNFIGAGLFVGYTAYSLAKENRQLIYQQKVDSYRSKYYQARLINDISGRSR